MSHVIWISVFLPMPNIPFIIFW